MFLLPQRKIRCATTSLFGVGGSGRILLFGHFGVSGTLLGRFGGVCGLSGRLRGAPGGTLETFWELLGSSGGTFWEHFLSEKQFFAVSD